MMGSQLNMLLSIVESHNIHCTYYTEARSAEVSLEKDKVLYCNAIPSLVNNQWMSMC
jgi:hypothetical protein